MSNHTSVPDDLAQRFGLVPVDELEVTHLDLWPDGRRPAVRPVTADKVMAAATVLSEAYDQLSAMAQGSTKAA